MSGATSAEKLVPVMAQVVEEVDVEVEVPVVSVVVVVVVVVAVQVPPPFPSCPVPANPVVGDAGSVPLTPPGARELVLMMPVFCRLSSERPNHRPSVILSTSRICGLRVHWKPATYCASMVSGTFSSRGSMPFFSRVTRLQF